MKISRPALAVAAAAVVAIGAVPAVQHAGEQGASSLTTIQRIQPADQTVTASAPTSVPAQDDQDADEQCVALQKAKDAKDAEKAAELIAAAKSAEKPRDLEKECAPDTATTAATTTTTTTTTEVVVEVPENEDAVGASVSDPESQEEGSLKEQLDSALDESGEGEDNMPAPVAATSAGLEEVKRLESAPQDYKGYAQAWFNRVQRIPGGEALTVHSTAMGRDIPVAVIRATDPQGRPLTGAPTYYLLNGAGGSEQNTDWLSMAESDVRKVFENEYVNVVIPMEGAFSYYVDWLTNPGDKGKYFHGEQKWSTFLVHELQPAIEHYLGANGRRAVTGFSMSATSSLLLAEHNPQNYDAVGSFSGCAATSTPLPSFFVGLTVNRGSAGAGTITPENLWGPRGSEYNRYNDALVMADNLKGSPTKFYVSAGTGLPGQTDMLSYLKENSGSAEALGAAMTLQIEGGAIEAAMNACTHDFNTKATKLGADVYFNRRPTGTHSWPIWRDDLHVSWHQVIKPALNGPDRRAGAGPAPEVVEPK